MTTKAIDKTEPSSRSRRETASKLAILLDRAERGDENCRSELLAFFRSGPEGTSLVEHYGSPAQWLKNTLVEQTAGNHIAIQVALEEKLATLRAELAGSSPSPLERLLAERAVLCWQVVHIYEVRYANAEGLPLRQAEYQEKRIDKAHARFLSAVKTLATVRKLAIPALQVNIAKTQVNVSG